jgi:hypothetical protein
VVSSGWTAGRRRDHERRAGAGEVLLADATGQRAAVGCAVGARAVGDAAAQVSPVSVASRSASMVYAHAPWLIARVPVDRQRDVVAVDGRR